MRHDAEITALDRVADGVMRLRLTLRPGEDGSASADFESGQFVRIVVPGSRARPAGRCGAPIRRPTWRTGTENWSSTSGTTQRRHVGYLSERAAVGDVLVVSADGDSVWRRTDFGRAGSRPVEPGCPRCCRCCARWPNGVAQPARLFFGVTRCGEVFARTRSPRSPRRYRTSTPKPWCGTQVRPGPGRWAIHVELASAEIAMVEEMPDVYLCGPPPMMDAAVAA